MKGGLRLKHLLEGKLPAEDDVVEVRPVLSQKKIGEFFTLGKRPADRNMDVPHGLQLKKPDTKENKNSFPSRKDRIKELENRYNTITKKCSSISVTNKSQVESSASSMHTSPMRLGQSLPYEPQKLPLGTLNPNTSHSNQKAPAAQQMAQDELCWSLPSSQKKQPSEHLVPNKSPEIDKVEETPILHEKPMLNETVQVDKVGASLENTFTEVARPNEEVTPKYFSADPETGLSYRAYSVTTHNGKVRSYNEDRVSIIQRIYLNCNQGIPTSFFGLFDGHCGVACANFLRDKLHHFVTKHAKFSTDKSEALKQGMLQCEASFLSAAAACSPQNPAGSCALVCMISNTTLFLGNVGDSRAIVSTHRGQICQALTEDHKPGLEAEKKRIFAAGGYIAKSKKQVSRVLETADGRVTELVEDVSFGPYRVFPGGFSVSRSIGDLPAKVQLGAKSMIAEPDITAHEITPQHDFLILASDGVFDVLGNQDIADEVWKTVSAKVDTLGLKEACKLACEKITQLAMQQDSTDNITVIIIAFQPKEYYADYCNKPEMDFIFSNEDLNATSKRLRTTCEQPSFISGSNGGSDLKLPKCLSVYY